MLHFGTEEILLAGSLLLLAGVVAGKTSSRFGVPTLLLFLVVGILAGSEGIGGIRFDDPHIAQLIGITALVFILFAGGMETSWQKIRPVLWQGISLSVAGVLVTAAVTGLFVHYLLGFTLAEGLLLGAIVSATDAAAVFSILRDRGLKLQPRVATLLEFESGSNDPMAYFLTITLTGVVATGDFHAGHIVFHFLKAFFIGGLAGYGMGKLALYIINRIALTADGLYPVLLLGLALFTYAATHEAGGNGFLAVYICALVLGNNDFIHKKSLLKFYEGQAWLMQLILFVTLGLLVFPSRVIPLMGTGMLVAVFLMLAARPIGVLTALAFFKTGWRGKLFVSLVGLRGSVPIVFATYPLLAGIDKAGMIFNLVFFISVTSVLLQGTALPLLARWFGVVDTTETEANKRPGIVSEIIIAPNTIAAGKRILDLHLPETTQILAIRRNNEYLQPTGALLLLAGDELFVLDKTGRSDYVHLFTHVGETPELLTNR